MPSDAYTLQLAEWLFVLAASFGAGAVAAGCALVARYGHPRRTPESVAGIAIVAAGLAAVSWVWLATSNRSPVQIVEEFDLGRVAHNAGVAATLAAAPMLALLALGLVVLAVHLLVPDGVRRGAALGVSVAGVTGGAAVGLLLAVDELAGFNAAPAGTTTGNEVTATLIYDGLTSPATGLAVTEDGEVLFAELEGRLGVLVPRDSGYAERTVLDFELADGAGLFHIALHPEWPDQPYLYASVQHVEDGLKTLRLVRLELDGLALADTAVVVEGLPTPQVPYGAPLNHFGAGVAVCDGYLYLTVGDNSFDARERAAAQIPARAEGKVLRYRLEGADLAPAGALNHDPPVYAMGFRNPFGAGCDPESGFPLVADNGNRGHDQVRLVESGSNHEWPFSDSRDVIAEPLYDTGPTSNIAPTGIAARRVGGSIEILVTAFNTGAVYRLVTSDGGAPHLDRLLRDRDGAFSIAVGGDGCVYYASATAVRRLNDQACPR